MHLRRLTLRLLYTVIVLTVANGSTAQQLPHEPTVQRVEPAVGKITANTRLVLIPVVVHDTAGKPVLDLKREDFELWEERVKREISVFELVHTASTPLARRKSDEWSNELGTAAPRSIHVIALDLINIPFLDRNFARKHLLKFLSSQVQSGELISLVVISYEGIQVIHDVSTDSAVLAKALAKVTGATRLQTTAESNTFEKVAPIEEIPDMMGDPVALEAAQLTMLTRGEAERSLLYQNNDFRDTLRRLRMLAQAHAGIPGRKSLLWITSRFPYDLTNPSLTGEFQRTVDALNDANMAVYPIDVRGLTTYVPDGAENKFDVADPRSPLKTVADWNGDTIGNLRLLAERTAGRAFFATNDLTRSLARASADAAYYYNIGYYVPSSETVDQCKPSPLLSCRNPGWRGLRLKVVRSGLDLRYRRGFYVTRPLTSEVAARDEMQMAMASPLQFAAIPMRLEWGRPSAEIKQGKRLLPFAILLPSDSLHVDAAKRTMSLEVKYRITNGAGAIVDSSQETVLGKIRIMDEFRLAPMRFESQIVAAPGKYQVKVLVRDNLTGKMGSVTGTTLVP